MTSYPNAPRLARAGIVLLDPKSGSVQRIVALQYNPESLTRTLTAKHLGEGEGAQPLRLTGPATETLRIEAEIDATDLLEVPDNNPDAVAHGIQPGLAALESLVHPAAARLVANNALAAAGTLEIVPMESPLPLFVWSASRIVPIRVTELSITEEAFDAALNPIRATVTLGMTVLTVDDLGFDHRGGTLSLLHHRQVERLSSLSTGAALSALGLSGIPA